MIMLQKPTSISYPGGHQHFLGYVQLGGIYNLYWTLYEYNKKT